MGVIFIVLYFVFLIIQLKNEDIKIRIYKVIGLIDDEEEYTVDEHQNVMRRDSVTDYLENNFIDTNDPNYIQRIQRVDQSL